MREVPARHHTGPKRILNNEVLPGLSSVGGQPLDSDATHISAQYFDPAYQALPAQENDAAHLQLFNHLRRLPAVAFVDFVVKALLIRIDVRFHEADQPALQILHLVRI